MENPKVLICGATGFVGGALSRSWDRKGVRVRVLARNPETARARLPPSTDIVGGDLVQGVGLTEALAGIDVAYYLVHSLASRSTKQTFSELDRQAATHFVRAARTSSLSRIVYVGGLGEEHPASSTHLASRREVARILRSGPVPLTYLRAGIIVGPHGSSFEMMAQLVERLPVMICPRWIESRCQPIALADLVRYLTSCATDDNVLGQTYDVGGPDVLPYSEMLLRIGAFLGRRPLLLVLPRFTPSLSAHWVGYITDVPAEVARSIVDGMYVDAVCSESRIREVFPGPLLGFDAAAKEALREAASSPGRRLRGDHVAGPLAGRVIRLYRAHPSNIQPPTPGPSTEPTGRGLPRTPP